MKHAFVLMTLLFPVLLQAAEPSAEMTAARARYAAALEAAAKPVRDRFVNELQAMKARAMTAKNLELAVAIDEQLKTVGVAGAAVQGSLRDRLTDTTWVWWQGETMTFLRNGKIRWSYDESSQWTWKVADQSKRTIEGWNPKGSFRITFEPDLLTGSLNESGKTARPTKRLSTP